MNAPIEYEQTDRRWRDIPYTIIGNPGDTIGTDGCGPTCASMVVATLRDKNVTPKEAAAWSVYNGHLSPHDGTYWTFFVPYLAAYGIKCIRTGNVDQAIDALKRDYMVITSVGRGIWTSIGHFILAYGLANNGTKVLIHDPNSEAPYREMANISNYRNESAQFWIIPEVWKVNLINIDVKNLDTDKMVQVSGFKVDGTNYIKFRDIAKLFPSLVVGNEGAIPTIKGGGDMTGEQIYNELQKYLAEQAAPVWSNKELEEAKKLGITDGTTPMQFIPRYQAAIMAKRAAKAKFTKVESK